MYENTIIGDEFARCLDIGRAAFNKWVHQGRIVPGFRKTGRLLHWTETEVQATLAAYHRGYTHDEMRALAAKLLAERERAKAAA